MSRLFLLDAYALIFRAYYALIKMPRIDTSGFNTSAIFGFVNTLEEVLRKEHPSHMAVCFDPPGPTFRSEAFEQYKGEREATPEDIKLSVPIIKEIIRAYNIRILEADGFEADDVIGTMATRAAAEGFTTYMMTPDKDFGQLVGPSVLQYKPAYRGQDFELRGEEEVCARYGLKETRQVIDLLALMGDKVDNIPGCPGVGEKTAIKLIEEFGSVENLIANTASLKGALRKKVEENSEQITFSKYLATIRTDVPLTEQPDDLRVGEPDREKLFAIFKSLEFKTLAERVRKRLDAGATTTPADTPLHKEERKDTPEPEAGESADMPQWKAAEARIVGDSEALSRLNRRLATAPRCGLFLVSEGENDMTARWLGTALTVESPTEGEYENYYLPATLEGATPFLLDLMARPDIVKVTHSAKRDMVIAANARAEVADTPAPESDSEPTTGLWAFAEPEENATTLSRNEAAPGDCATALAGFEDIGLLHYLLQPDLRHTPEALAATLLGHEMLPVPRPAGRKSKDTPFAGVPDSDIAPWACENAETALRLLPVLEKKLRECGMYHLYTDLERPLSAVLADMERIGVCLDVKALDKAAEEMEGRLRQIEAEVYEITGEEFNISSPAKVGEILFERMGLDPKAKKTRTGQYSTSEEVLEKIAHKSPAVGKILEYRQLRKLLNTYLTALPACINPATGRVHTNYNQTVTATGRISSSSPNLQNIPVRENEGREIRRAFIPSPGNLFLSADYSQIELRLVADFAREQVMTDAFLHDGDIHAATAARIYHKDVADVTADERRHAKTANFGILYGITPFGLASRLGIPRADARDLIDNYFSEFSGIRKYMSDSVEKARELGYVETQMGRRRYLPDINSRNPVVRGYAERNAVNAPVQGSAADIIKVAMIRIAGEMQSRGMRSRMIMQVHDELNFDVVPEELATLQELVVRLMQEAYSGTVPLTASCGAAANWLDAH